MSNALLTKSYIAAAAVAAFRIVKFGASDYEVEQGAAAADSLVGVSDELGAALGDRVDVVRSGLADVEYGGAVTQGDELTSDANGKAVVAAPGAGANVRIIGMAEVSGVAGDIGSVSVNPSVMQG